MPTPGARSDLVDCVNRKLEGASTADLLEEFGCSYIRYKRHICEAAASIVEVESRKEPLKNYDDVEWRPWQQEVIERVGDEPHPRKIHWYIDRIGNVGKTFLATYLVLTQDCIRFENGKSLDIKHAYAGQKICIFDFSRSMENHINYEVIESIKNGIMFSSKYDSSMKIYKKPISLVFAHFAPDLSTLSADRWDIITL